MCTARAGIPAVFAAVLAGAFLASCDSKPSKVTPPPPPPPGEQAPPPMPPAREPGKPTIDLSAVDIRAPARVRRNEQFTAKVTVANVSGPQASVLNVELRAGVTHATGATNIAAGTGIIRNLKPGTRQTVSIQARAPSQSGVGTLTAIVNAVGAEDPRSSNNKIETRLVID